MTDEQRAVAMTLRVSRDSGRTWGPLREYREIDPPADENPGRYPPCQCPRHRRGGHSR